MKRSPSFAPACALAWLLALHALPCRAEEVGGARDNVPAPDRPGGIPPAGQEKPAAPAASPGGAAQEGGAAGTAAGTRSAGVQAERVRKPHAITIRLSLEDVLRLGLENNLDIRISRLDDNIRRRELIIARSIFDPFFNLGALYAKNRDPSVSFFDLGTGAAAQGVRVSPSETTQYSAGLGGTAVTGAQYDFRLAQVERDRPVASRAGFTFLNPVTSTELSLAARQPLLKGAWYSITTSDVRIAQNNIEISKEQLELTAIGTVFEIEQAYWELVFATQNFEAKTKSLQVTVENLENVRKKRAVGTLAAIDVTTAESQAALRRVELEDAEELREVARDQLLRLINYTRERSLKEHWEAGGRAGPFEEILVICTTEPVLEPLTVDRDSALAAAFVKRPEYRQLELNVANQQLRIEVSKNQLLPALDLTGRWAQLGLESAFDQSYSELSTGRYYDWEVGIELSIPLSNRGPKSRHRNARDELRKLKVGKNDLENDIVLEVDQAFRKIEYLRRKVQDLDERVRLQEELLRAERRKVDVGMSIAYTVSVIENDLVADQTQALRAKADLQIARAELLRSMGTLLDQHRIAVEPSRD